MMGKIEDRFWSKVNKGSTDNDCWLWAGTILSNGYGQFQVAGGRRASAHRFAYELLIGPIGEGLHIDHLCRVTNCVNPKHLEPVTSQINTLRGIGPSAVNAVRTQCVNGHGFTDDNTYITPNGRRQCRTCLKARAAAYEAKRPPRKWLHGRRVAA